MRIDIEGYTFNVIDVEDIDINTCYGFIYVSINEINNKKYIGQKTIKTEKGLERSDWKTYLGSGSVIRKAIKKYGKENFKRYIIDIARTQAKLDKKETYYINEVFNAATNNSWYNIKDGSQHGGNPYAGKTNKEREEANKKRSEKLKGKNNPMYGKEGYWKGKKRIELSGENHPFYNQKRSLETKQKIRKTLIEKGIRKGKNNPMYGVYRSGTKAPNKKACCVIKDGVTIKKFDLMSDLVKWYQSYTSKSYGATYKIVSKLIKSKIKDNNGFVFLKM